MYMNVLSFFCGMVSTVGIYFYFYKKTNLSQLRSVSSVVLNSINKSCVPISEAKLINNYVMIPYKLNNQDFITYLPYNKNSTLENFTFFKIVDETPIDMKVDPHTSLLITPRMLNHKIMVSDIIENENIELSDDQILTV